jgi:transposase
VPDEPGLPSAEKLAVLQHGVLAERLAEAYRLIAQLTAWVEAPERQVAKPRSSDSPFRKKPQDRSLREKGRRAPDKQPGEPGTTMCLVDDPDERLFFLPVECRRWGEGLAGEPVSAQRRHQITDIEPAPVPRVTEYVA